MQTDELRELLERYPELSRTEKQRLRQLYHDASATDVLAIMSNSELAAKARRLDRPSDLAWDWCLAVMAALLAFAVGLYLLLIG